MRFVLFLFLLQLLTQSSCSSQLRAREPRDSARLHAGNASACGDAASASSSSSLARDPVPDAAGLPRALQATGFFGGTGLGGCGAGMTIDGTASISFSSSGLPQTATRVCPQGRYHPEVATTMTCTAKSCSGSCGASAINCGPLGCSCACSTCAPSTPITNAAGTCSPVCSPGRATVQLGILGCAYGCDASQCGTWSITSADGNAACRAACPPTKTGITTFYCKSCGAIAASFPNAVWGADAFNPYQGSFTCSPGFFGAPAAWACDSTKTTGWAGGAISCTACPTSYSHPSGDCVVTPGTALNPPTASCTCKSGSYGPVFSATCKTDVGWAVSVAPSCTPCGTTVPLPGATCTVADSGVTAACNCGAGYLPGAFSAVCSATSGWIPAPGSVGCVIIPSTTPSPSPTPSVTPSAGPCVPGGTALVFSGLSPLVAVPVPGSAANGSNARGFAVDLWVRPDVGTYLPTPQCCAGVDFGPDASTGARSYNFAIFPSHGYYWQNPSSTVSTDAGMGVAVGTNGVALVMHSGGLFLPFGRVAINLVPSRYHHIAVSVAPGNVASIYVNGALGGVALQSTITLHPSAEVGGGYYRELFTGGIASYRVWGRALSAAEVAAISRFGVGPGGWGGVGDLAVAWEMEGSTVAEAFLKTAGSASSNLSLAVPGTGGVGYPITPISPALEAVPVMCSTSPTPSATLTPTSSVTPSVSPTSSGTPSVTPSRSASSTPSSTVTPSGSASPSISGSPSASSSNSPSITPSRTPSTSRTPSSSFVPSRTASRTPSRTTSRSGTPTATTSASQLPAGTAAPTPSISGSRTPTTSATPSSSVSTSASASASASVSASASGSVTATRTRSRTQSVTRSRSRTPSESSSASTTPSPSTSPSPSASASASVTGSLSATRTVSASASTSSTPSLSATASTSATASSCPSPTASPSGSSSPSASTTATSSSSATASTSGTVSSTVTATASRSASGSGSSTPSLTPSTSYLPSGTVRPTPSVSVTLSGSPSVTPSASVTASASASASVTSSPSVTATASITRSVINSRTPTPSTTATPSSTRSPSRSVSATVPLPSSSSQRGGSASAAPAAPVTPPPSRSAGAAAASATNGVVAFASAAASTTRPGGSSASVVASTTASMTAKPGSASGTAVAVAASDSAAAASGSSGALATAATAATTAAPAAASVSVAAASAASAAATGTAAVLASTVPAAAAPSASSGASVAAAAPSAPAAPSASAAAASAAATTGARSSGAPPSPAPPGSGNGTAPAAVGAPEAAAAAAAVASLTDAGCGRPGYAVGTRCSACIPGYYRSPDDGVSCLQCPAQATLSDSLLPALAVVGYAAAFSVPVGAAVAWAHAKEGGTLKGGAERAGAFFLAIFSACQVLVQSIVVTPALPAPLAALYARLAVLQFRGVTLPPACSNGDPLMQDTTYLAVVAGLVALLPLAAAAQRRWAKRSEAAAVASSKSVSPRRSGSSPTRSSSGSRCSRFRASLPRHALRVYLLVLFVLLGRTLDAAYNALACSSSSLTLLQYAAYKNADGSAVAGLVAAGSLPATAFDSARACAGGADATACLAVQPYLSAPSLTAAVKNDAVCWEGSHTLQAGLAGAALLLQGLVLPLGVCWYARARLRGYVTRPSARLRAAAGTGSGERGSKQPRRSGGGGGGVALLSAKKGGGSGGGGEAAADVPEPPPLPAAATTDPLLAATARGTYTLPAAYGFVPAELLVLHALTALQAFLAPAQNTTQAVLHLAVALPLMAAFGAALLKWRPHRDPEQLPVQLAILVLSCLALGLVFASQTASSETVTRLGWTVFVLVLLSVVVIIATFLRSLFRGARKEKQEALVAAAAAAAATATPTATPAGSAALASTGSGSAGGGGGLPMVLSPLHAPGSDSKAAVPPVLGGGAGAAVASGGVPSPLHAPRLAGGAGGGALQRKVSVRLGDGWGDGDESGGAGHRGSGATRLARGTLLGGRDGDTLTRTALSPLAMRRGGLLTSRQTPAAAAAAAFAAASAAAGAGRRSIGASGSSSSSAAAAVAAVAAKRKSRASYPALAASSASTVASSPNPLHAAAAAAAASY